MAGKLCRVLPAGQCGGVTCPVRPQTGTRANCKACRKNPLCLTALTYTALDNPLLSQGFRYVGCNAFLPRQCAGAGADLGVHDGPPWLQDGARKPCHDEPTIEPVCTVCFNLLLKPTASRTIFAPSFILTLAHFVLGPHNHQPRLRALQVCPHLQLRGLGQGARNRRPGSGDVSAVLPRDRCVLCVATRIPLAACFGHVHCPA